jgi:aspartyl-tRNA(Asn)/glutamyl-tRNA(Gln) amidotransferase subunit B
VGELPQARRRRYVEALGISERDAATLAGDRETGDFFERVVGKLQKAPAKRVANLLLSHGLRIANARGRPLHDMGISSGHFADLADMLESNELSPSAAGQLLDRIDEVVVRPGVAEVRATAHGPSVSIRTIAQDEGLMQVSDTGAIDTAIDALVAQNPRPLQDYRAGKQQAMGALVGMVMRAGKGLNPKIVQERLREKLGG